MKPNLYTEIGLLEFILNESSSVDIQAALGEEHSASIKGMEDFKLKPDWSTGGQFRRTNGGVIFGSKKVPNNVSIIWGQLKTQSGKATSPQALRFPIKSWAAPRAKSWMKENGVNYVAFTEAQKKNAENNAVGNNASEKVENRFFLDFSTPAFKVLNASGKNNEPAVVYVYGVIGGWDIDAKSMVEQLVSITAKEIHLHIHSPGGSIMDGWAITNTIRGLKDKTVISFIDGECCSMAVSIAQAADYRHMAADALMMIHNPRYSNFSGDAKQLRDGAELLDKIKSVMVNRLLEKSNMDEKEINEAMDKTTFYTAQEALDAGLVDNIGDPLSAVACFDPKSVFTDPETLARYESLSNKSKVTNSKGGSKMNLEKIKAEYPELYAQIFNLGKAEGVTEGKAAGMVEGKAAGLAEGKGANVADAVSAAAKAEVERIKAIEALSMPGFESIISENKFKPEMTAEKVSLLILAKQRTDNAAAAENLSKDGAALAAQVAGISNAAPAGKQTPAAQAADDAVLKAAAEAINKNRR